MQRLPTRLEREPLIEAIFEVRLGGNPHIADILPGVLFNRFKPKPTIQRLPAADIPQPIRARDPNLAFQPTTRLDMKDFTISFSENGLIIGCKIPYPKWERFKQEIIKIIKLSSVVGISGPVERYSLKYVNIVNAPTVAAQIEKINMLVQLGDVKLTDEHVSLQVHHKEGETMHIMTIITSAQAHIGNDKLVFGVVVDIDSIRTVNYPDLVLFAQGIEPILESLRQENKTKFFSCLTEATISEMEPTYD